MHTHAFPDSLANHAIAALEGQIDGRWRAVGNGRIDGLIAAMDAADIDFSVVCAIATKPSQVKNIFKWCKAVTSDRIIAFPSIHPHTKKPGKWLDRFAKAGFAGIKLHPMYQSFEVDDEAMDPIYSAAAANDLIVQMHSGYDIAFGDDESASPERLARVIDRHPDMKLLCTHLGAWKAWDDVRKYLLGSEVYMETSFSLQWLGQADAARLIRDHGPGKVMFGTDWPWQDQAEQVSLARSLDLTEAEIDALFWSNAARLLGF